MSYPLHNRKTLDQEHDKLHYKFLNKLLNKSQCWSNDKLREEISHLVTKQIQTNASGLIY